MKEVKSRERQLVEHVVELSGTLAGFLLEVPMPLGVTKTLEKLLARSRQLVPEMHAVVTKTGKVRPGVCKDG